MKPNIQKLADYINQQEAPERFMEVLLALVGPKKEGGRNECVHRLRLAGGKQETGVGLNPGAGLDSVTVAAYNEHRKGVAGHGQPLE